METDPNVVPISKLREVESRWLRAEDHRRVLIDTLVKLVDKDYEWYDGFLMENQLSCKDVNDARNVLRWVCDGTLKDSDMDRPFVVGDKEIPDHI